MVAREARIGPVGLVLPAVRGHSLDGREVVFPRDTRGAPAVLLVAYRRATAPDTERWKKWLEDRGEGVCWFGVPAIAGRAWRALADTIDRGMRAGLPESLWPRIVTLYDDAKKVAAFLGDDGRDATRVVLLDADGVVAWFHASGYTEDAASSLVGAIRALSAR